MTQHIGIVAGTAEGAALCYRTICLEAPAVMGEHNHPEITLHTMPVARYMPHIRANDWETVARLLTASAQKVAQAGADFAICPVNTFPPGIQVLDPAVPDPLATYRRSSRGRCPTFSLQAARHFGDEVSDGRTCLHRGVRRIQNRERNTGRGR